MDIIEKRKEEVLNKLKSIDKIPKKLIYLVMLVIAWFGYYIRIQNLPLLKDASTGKFIPLALDPHVFLRYVRYLLEHGQLMANDVLRYYPIGWTNLSEFKVLSYFIVYLYKFMHLFSSSMTIEKAHVLYPPICFFFGAIFFFLFVKKLFNWKVGLIATAILAVVPPYLYRTMAGFSDKEAFAMMGLFLALYLFVSSFKQKDLKKSIALGIGSGIVTGIAGVVWGGLAYIYLTLGTFAIISILFGNFKKKDLYTYASWLVFTFIFLNLLYPERFTWSTLLTSTTTLVPLLGLILGIVHHLIFKENIFKLRNKLREKIPLPDGLISIILTLVVGIILLSIVLGPSFLFEKLREIFIGLTHPFGETRWQLTVAEAHQPYFVDWLSQLTPKYVVAFLVSSVLLFYNLVRKFKKQVAYGLTTLFTAFILLFTMSRYSQSSFFNGENTISLALYLGSIAGFFILIFYFYIQSYKKDKESFNLTKNLDKSLLFTIIFFIFLTVGARSAIRLLFLYAPITAILVAYGAVVLFKEISKIKQDIYKIAAYALIIIFIVVLLHGFSKTVMTQAENTGPSYNMQWQNAMTWVRENTPEDAIFAHWWDYGYWVQTGGERATLSDGGNSRGAINHFIGRHVLTATSEREALELLKANDATHFLAISDEIGKYPAFSSIGADANYDRYSWIQTFQMDQSKTQETRNSTVFVYTGATAVDHDFVYKDTVFPGGSAAIGGFLVPISTQEVKQGNETKVVQKIMQPSAILVYNGRQSSIPLECVYADGQLLEFEQKGLPGCLVFIPKISGNQQNVIGAALYLSPTVREGLFAQLYLFNKESEYFKLVHNDKDRMPLAYYNGRIIGPLKIWEVSYPDDLVIPEEYYGTKLPDTRVREIRR